MPFGWRNGPPVFQHVMQEILAPYLWLFALVYIDNVVVYSPDFESHLKHVDEVLGANHSFPTKMSLSLSKHTAAGAEGYEARALDPSRESTSATRTRCTSELEGLMNLSGNGGVLLFIHPILRLTG